MQTNGSWTKYITPVLVTIAIFMLGTIMAQVNRIDEKLFHHLANDELHTPRSLVVSKAEFEIHCRFFEKENDRIIRAIDELRNDLKVKSRDGRSK